MAALGVLSASLCAPALPSLAEHFSAPFFHIQFIMSLFLAGNAFGQLLSGPLSDRLGRRGVLLGALFIYVLASCGCAVSDSLPQLLACRFLQGAGSAAGPVLARAIATSNFSPCRSAQIQAYGAAGIGFASISAILLSGPITHLHWRGAFWLAAGLGTILWLWGRKATPDELPKNHNVRFPIWDILKTPRFAGYTLCHSLTYGLMYGYMTLFPFLLTEFFDKNSPIQVSVWSAWMIGMYMIGALTAAYFVRKLSSKNIITAGLCLQGISGILLALVLPTPFFLGALCVLNLGLGIILPLTSAAALAPFAERCAGFASSALGLSYRILGFVVSTLICQFAPSRGLALGLAIVLLTFVSSVMQRLCLRWEASRIPSV